MRAHPCPLITLVTAADGTAGLVELRGGGHAEHSSGELDAAATPPGEQEADMMGARAEQTAANLSSDAVSSWNTFQATFEAPVSVLQAVFRPAVAA